MARPPENSQAAAHAPKGRWEDFGRLVSLYTQAEWFGSPFHLWSLSGPRPQGVAASPRDPRPADAKRGQDILRGVFTFASGTLPPDPNTDLFERKTPNEAFAGELQRMNWLRDLTALGEPGEIEALRLLLVWLRGTFGRWHHFSWKVQRLERRVINMACALRAVAARASDLEQARLTDSLARQARHLLLVRDGPAHAAEHACAAAIAGTALGGRAGDKLMSRALSRLAAALPHSVLADGGHATRSPEAGLNLLLDLLILEDGLSQRGRPAPDEMSRALDRLTAALRVLGAPDGRMACFQGGEAGRAGDLAAALRASDLAPADGHVSLPHAGYERLSGKALTVIADAAAPAGGAWSETACAQPVAIEIYSGADRLVTNCGWSARVGPPEALRLTTAASTLCLGEASTGEPSRGRIGRPFRARLRGGPAEVDSRRQETAQGAWLEMSHDGWVPAFGLRHERLLYLDRDSDELRGEDRLTPADGTAPVRVAPVAVRFHLSPNVKASLARDRKSVLIQGPSAPGWWLRNDAEDVAIEHSVHYEDGQPRRSTQVVLRSQFAAREGGRIRWKLAAVRP